MENQHRKIGGYGELEQADIDLINEAKDGEEAYHYHQLMEMWLQREGSSGQNLDFRQ